MSPGHQIGVRNTELGFGVDEVGRAVRHKTDTSPITELRTGPQGSEEALTKLVYVWDAGIGIIARNLGSESMKQ